MNTVKLCYKLSYWDFPGGPVAKTPCSQCRGSGFPGRGARSHGPQLKILHAATKKKKKILHATTKTQCSQINKYFKN